MKTKLAGILFLLVFVSFASAACVAHWSMNNTGGLTDACSSTYTLTNVSADDGQSCVFNECYDFERDTSWYMTDGDLDLASDFSICLWYKPESTGAVHGLVSKYSGTDTATNYVLTLAANNSLRLFVADGASLYFLYSNSTLDAGKWYHICTWYNDSANTIGFWINNSRAGVDTGPASVATSSAGVQIGRISAGAGSYADGLIDDIWMLDSVVTSTQVGNLFYLGALEAPPPPVGCTVTHVEPTNATFNTTSYNIFVGKAVCYQSMADNCSLYVNGTVVYPVNTTMTNGTNFYINASVSNGMNQWHLKCTNGTFSNTTSMNLTLFIGVNCTSTSTSTINYSLMSEFVWNYSSGRNVTSMDWAVYANWDILQGFVWNTTARTLTSFGSLVADIVAAIQASTLVADIEAAVWGSGSRTLTDYNQTGVSACSNMTTPYDVWIYAERNLTWYNCSGGANATYNVSANCSVNVEGCTRPIVLKTGDCS